MTDADEEFFRPLSDKEIRERIALVREAKRLKGYRQQLTARELDRILGPSVEDVLGSLSSTRRNMARIKIDNFGLIGVTKIDNKPTFKAHANSRGRTRSKEFSSYVDAVNQRNEWARELWPGIPEALCDMDAAKRKWGRKRRGKHARKVAGDSGHV